MASYGQQPGQAWALAAASAQASHTPPRSSSSITSPLAPHPLSPSPQVAFLLPSWGFHYTVPHSNLKVPPDPAGTMFLTRGYVHLMLDQLPPRMLCRTPGWCASPDESDSPSLTPPSPLTQQQLKATSSATEDGLLHIGLARKKCPEVRCKEDSTRCPQRQEKRDSGERSTREDDQLHAGLASKKHPGPRCKRDLTQRDKEMDGRGRDSDTWRCPGK